MFKSLNIVIVSLKSIKLFITNLVDFQTFLCCWAGVNGKIGSLFIKYLLELKKNFLK